MPALPSLRGPSILIDLPACGHSALRILPFSIRMSDFATYRPSSVAAPLSASQTLPPSALTTFKRQIEDILRGYGVDLSGVEWFHIDKTTIETLDFKYRMRPLHLYASIRHTELGFGISYLSDFGTREVISAPPPVAPVEAAAAIQRTLTRVWSAGIPPAAAQGTAESLS
jgi:hypothetical protein